MARSAIEKELDKLEQVVREKSQEFELAKAMNEQIKATLRDHIKILEESLADERAENARLKARLRKYEKNPN